MSVDQQELTEALKVARAQVALAHTSILALQSLVGRDIGGRSVACALTKQDESRQWLRDTYDELVASGAIVE